MKRITLVLGLLACGDAEYDSGGSADTSDSGEACGEWFRDADDDGFGAGAPLVACAAPDGYVAIAEDCDDGAPGVHPGAPEACNLTDDDCDGDVDETPAEGPDWFVDADGDMHGAGAPEIACDAPAGRVAEGDDCDDDDARVYPGAEERCQNGRDDDCDGEEDEADATDADTFYTDADGDGHGDAAAPLRACALPAGAAWEGDDCDDTDPAAHPDADEVCGGGDDDCDGAVDEADATDAASWHADADADGYGDPAAVTLACDAPLDHVADASDCDDADPAVNPGALEWCGGGDEDCDGEVDEDSAADAGSWFLDADGDGHGDASAPTSACEAPVGHVAGADDCDDSDAGVSPGADEVCGGGDEDCDGTVDEDAAVDAETWYTDADGDGYGDDGTAASSCTAPTGAVAQGGDCDDADADRSPGQPEVCGTGLDEDCDGDADEACAIPAGAYTAADAGLTILGEPDTTIGRDGLLVADLDGDGVNTLIVATTYGWDSTPQWSGSVYLFDAPGTGTLAWTDADTTFYGAGTQYRLGNPVLAGDQDGDGVQDLFAAAVFTRTFDCNGGAVVLSGAALGATPSDCGDAGRFGEVSDGREVAGPLAAPDMDGDGVQDLAAWLSDDLFVSYGPIDSWSRASGADVIVTDAASTVPTLMARGDYDGDGHDELVFGAADRVWRCEAPISAASPAAAGCVTAISEASSASWGFGTTVSTLGDSDGDGTEDGLLVGAPGYQSGSMSAADGLVLRFTGSLVALDVADADATWSGLASGDQLGASRVFAPGDLDADGEPDVGFAHKTSGAYLDYDVVGHAGTLADADVALTGPAADYFGWDATAGDVDSDGSVDLVVSSVWDSTGGTYAGAVYVLYAN